jgi:hypothetical protein
MSPLVFRTLLKPFPNVTHSTYSNYGEAEPPFSFYPHEMRLRIIHSQPSLQELTIINTQEEIETVDYLMGENEGLPLGSLVKFHNLRRLEAMVRTLVGRRPGDPGFDSSLPKDLQTGSRVCENSRFAESLPEELELVLKACLILCGGEGVVREEPTRRIEEVHHRQGNSLPLPKFPLHSAVVLSQALKMRDENRTSIRHKMSQKMGNIERDIKQKLIHHSLGGPKP